MSFFKNNFLLPLFSFNDNLKIFLIIIFSFLYLPHVFILVHDLGLITAYETDPGSIISSLQEVLKNYNMHDGYHSKYYGWTYFAINYAILKPIDLFFSLTELKLLLNIDNNFHLFNPVRLILFTIGLISLLAFYEILKILFSDKTLIFVGSIMYIIADVGYEFFYFVHPESTGMMFIFLALLSLLKFKENPIDRTKYFYGLIFLVLASLSKQIFFFVSLPILALFFHTYCFNENIKYHEFLFSKIFGKIFLYTIIITFGILLLIHPYSIFEFEKFLNHQLEFKQFVTGKYSFELKKAIEEWIKSLSSVPILVCSIFFFPISLILSLIFYLRSKKLYYFFYVVNAVSLLLIIMLVIFGNRLFIYSKYIYPIYPFLIINILSIIYFIKNMKFNMNQILKFPLIIFFTIFIILNISRSITYNVPQIFNRFDYKESIAYKTHRYIIKNLKKNDKLVYDHFVALPSHMKKIGCHYWHGCGTDYINEYSPNYVMFNEDWDINKQETSETKILKKYVKENKLKLITSITAKEITVSIYKKL